jgi:hypothetical protein
MTKESRKKDKAIKKIDKAVHKAVDKGISQTAVEETVKSAMNTGGKAHSAKAKMDEESSLNDEPMIPYEETHTIKKGLGKRKLSASPLE